MERVAGNRNGGLDAKGRWALADPVDEVFRLVSSIGKRTDDVTHRRLRVIVQGLDIVCQRVGAVPLDETAQASFRDVTGGDLRAQVADHLVRLAGVASMMSNSVRLARPPS